MASITTNGQDRDPVSLFEAHRTQMIRDRMVVNITLLVVFLGFLLWSLWISRVTPERLAAGILV